VSILEDVRIDWPWPYTEDHLAALAAGLPAANANIAIEGIVREARRYLAPPAVEARDAAVKPDAAKQIARVQVALEGLLAALKAMDLEALIHLRNSAKLDDQTPLVFLRATFAFEMNPGLKHLPNGVGPGRPAKAHLTAFLARTRKLYDAAFSEEPPFRGWPRFMETCLAPLGVEHVSAQARNRQLQAAKRNRN
jgi:hypothetical protein